VTLEFGQIAMLDCQQRSLMINLFRSLFWMVSATSLLDKINHPRTNIDLDIFRIHLYCDVLKLTKISDQVCDSVSGPVDMTDLVPVTTPSLQICVGTVSAS